jgi:hypothetical protein
MTIGSTTVATTGSNTNGATTQFSFSFRVQDYGAVEAEDQIRVTLVNTSTGAETVLTRGASAGQYSVSINGDQDSSPGGSITTVTTYAAGYKIYIELSPSFLQTTDYQNQGGFLAATVESQHDQQQMQINVLKDKLRRTPYLSVAAGSSFDGEITGPFTPGLGPVVNSDGTGWDMAASVVSEAMSAPVVADTRAEGAFLLGVPWFDPSWAPYSADNTGSSDASSAISTVRAAAESAKRPILIQGSYKIGGSSISGDNMSFVGFAFPEMLHPFTDSAAQFLVTDTTNNPWKLGESVSFDRITTLYPNQKDTTTGPITYPALFVNENSTTQVSGLRLENKTIIGATDIAELGGLTQYEVAGYIRCNFVTACWTRYAFNLTHVPERMQFTTGMWGYNVYADEVLHFGDGGTGGILAVSVTESAGVGTYDTGAVEHGLSVGRHVSVVGFDQSEYNVTDGEVLSVPTPTTFTLAVAGSPASPGTGSAPKLHIYPLRDTIRDEAIFMRFWGDGTTSALSSVSVDGGDFVGQFWYGIKSVFEGAGDPDGGVLGIVTGSAWTIDGIQHLLKVNPGDTVRAFNVTGLAGYQFRVADPTWFGYLVDVEDPAPNTGDTPSFNAAIANAELGFMRGGIASLEGDYIDRFSLENFSCDAVCFTTENGDRVAVYLDCPNADIVLHMGHVKASNAATGTRTFVHIVNARSVDVTGVFDGWDCVVKNDSATAKVSFNGKTFNDGDDAIQGTYAGNVDVSIESYIESMPTRPLKSLVAELASMMPNRNVLLNGCARIWQQGTSFDSTTTPANNDDTYLADQVILLSDGNDIIDFSQETTTKPDGAYAAFKLDVETANKKFGLLFPVEARNAARLINGNAVASFEARKGGSNATAETLRAAIISWQGTADSITSDVVSAWGSAGTNPTLVSNWTYETTPENLTLTTSFQKFDEDNGLAGAIDTASTKQFALFIWCDDTDATVGDLIYIGKVQLEAGLVATPFDHRDRTHELLACQRYFCRLASGWTGTWLDANNAIIGGRFPVAMRAAPTASLNTTAPQIAELGVANRTGSASAIVNAGTITTTGVGAMRINGFSSATANKIAQGIADFMDYTAQL